jgi:hypothetical protein
MSQRQYGQKPYKLGLLLTHDLQGGVPAAASLIALYCTNIYIKTKDKSLAIIAKSTQMPHLVMQKLRKNLLNQRRGFEGRMDD